MAQVASQRAAEKEAANEAAAERVAAAARKAAAQEARKAEREASARANEAKAEAKRREREEDARLAMEQQEAQLREKEARKAEKELQRCAREREKEEAREVTEGAARAALLPTTAVEPGITSSPAKFCDVLKQVPLATHLPTPLTHGPPANCTDLERRAPGVARLYPRAVPRPGAQPQRAHLRGRVHQGVARCLRGRQGLPQVAGARGRGCGLVPGTPRPATPRPSPIPPTLTLALTQT